MGPKERWANVLESSLVHYHLRLSDIEDPGPLSSHTFRRVECKYLVDEATAAAVRGAIRPYVHVDPHALEASDRSYDITSLYLDAPDLRLFWESQEGQLHRLKLRLRDYGDDGPVFMEIKRRRDRLVHKSRARLDRAGGAAFLAGGFTDTSYLPAAERACYQEFSAWSARWLARPVVWIRYRREAYAGRANSRVRVTIDRDLRCAPAGPSLESPRTWRTLEPRGLILEFKFDGAHPTWLRRLVQRHELRQRSYSKYGNAVLRGLDRRELPPRCAAAVPV